MNEIDRLRKENESLKKQIEQLEEKIDEKAESQKKAMTEAASKGGLMSRPPFGYIMEHKALVPAANFSEVEDIFNEFLSEGTSLHQIAQKHKISVNGLKKILKNFTYIGKIKFNNQVHSGNHKPIISTTLFNHVQDKLEMRKIR